MEQLLGPLRENTEDGEKTPIRRIGGRFILDVHREWVLEQSGDPL